MNGDIHAEARGRACMIPLSIEDSQSSDRFIFFLLYSLRPFGSKTAARRAFFFSLSLCMSDSLCRERISMTNFLFVGREIVDRLVA
jgi:hypothetical protein